MQEHVILLVNKQCCLQQKMAKAMHYKSCGFKKRGLEECYKKEERDGIQEA
jgi:hypothetical protein